MADLVKDIIEAAGYPGIAFLTFIENVFPPIPSEIIIPFSGYITNDSHLHLTGVIIAGSLGSLLGAYPLYYLGSYIGEDRLKEFFTSYGRWFMISGSDIERASDWFEKYGEITIFLSRLVPGVRSLISVPAGFNQMNLFKFSLYTVSGTTLWTAILAWAGMQLGKNYTSIQEYLNPVSYIVFGGLLLWYVWYVVKNKGSRNH